MPSVWVKEKAKQLQLGETVSKHLTNAARHQSAARAMDQNIVTFLASLLAARHPALYNNTHARSRHVIRTQPPNRRLVHRLTNVGEGDDTFTHYFVNCMWFSLNVTLYLFTLACIDNIIAFFFLQSNYQRFSKLKHKLSTLP